MTLNPSAEAPRSAVLVDAHVHCHSCFSIRDFLDSGAGNLTDVATDIGCTDASRVLMIADSADQSTFDRLRKFETTRADPTWKVSKTSESTSLNLTRESGEKLVIVAGRQLKTAEGLEVLALAFDSEAPSDLSLEETIAVVRSRSGIPVVPWGFGKWWATRGSLLETLLENEDPNTLFLGDTGKRPALSRSPRLMHKATTLGFRNLPGSDPFPFPRQLSVIGSLGFMLSGFLDSDRPASSLKSILESPLSQPKTFGVGSSLSAFVRDQIAIRRNIRRLEHHG